VPYLGDGASLGDLRQKGFEGVAAGGAEKDRHAPRSIYEADARGIIFMTLNKYGASRKVAELLTDLMNQEVVTEDEVIQHLGHTRFYRVC
jgi:hypothetical protein